MTMEVLVLVRDLVDINLRMRDVREIIAGWGPGDVARFRSGCAVSVVLGKARIDRFGWCSLVDKRDGWDRDWDNSRVVFDG